jgi:hypothetical protein
MGRKPGCTSTTFVWYHCLPAVLRTDRGLQFTSQFFQEIFLLCGTKQVSGTAYHPQSQGLTEHANRVVIEGLRHYLHGVYADWDEHKSWQSSLPTIILCSLHWVLPLLSSYMGSNPVLPSHLLFRVPFQWSQSLRKNLQVQD